MQLWGRTCDRTFHVVGCSKRASVFRVCERRKPNLKCRCSVNSGLWRLRSRFLCCPGCGPHFILLRVAFSNPISCTLKEAPKALGRFWTWDQVGNAGT